MDALNTLGIIAGNGVYPRLLADAARRAGVKRIVAAAFTDETDDRLAVKVDEIHWMRVGQLGKLIACFRAAGVTDAIMAGQIAPKNLFDLRPDWKTLLLLARLKRRNAESIFAAIGDELARATITLLPATSFLEDCLAPAGLIAGRKLTRREEEDVALGFEIAREISRLDIGQTVIVKNGTVLAVEGFEGTNETIKRGGALGGRNAIMIKVAKPNQGHAVRRAGGRCGNGRYLRRSAFAGHCCGIRKDTTTRKRSSPGISCTLGHFHCRTVKQSQGAAVSKPPGRFGNRPFLFICGSAALRVFA